MIPRSILYVDDEAMALKYFERLVSPLAPVIVASSVAEGKAVLELHAGQIAVLVSDQRMPGARGNELLRYARERHPSVVRMLTTAYSELGEAIEAINSGEIYRYITKPWDLESLHADLRNALELALLRAERDSLLREKMLLQQQQLLGHRAGQLALVGARIASEDSAKAVHTFLQTALAVGCSAPAVDWRAIDYAELIQAEARRGIAIDSQLAQWHQVFSSAESPAEALAALARALAPHASLHAESLIVSDSLVFSGLLSAAPQELPASPQLAWLAWILRWGTAVRVRRAGPGWEASLVAGASGAALSHDWLAADIESLLQAVARG